ncbi:MAG: hypothetical protein A2287_10545 [Candidatus Melainabacteria bacterium RIFOXYA12_FULL_32_12]|nr:MAG: hypothetical protein A2287_10545 [Candidatus Melainabacteria bacterium RIFOXYA12_FULL_32_12]
MTDLVYADFHCHIDLFPNPPEIIEFFEKNKIFIVAATTTPKAWKQNKKWTQNKTFIRPSLGLHPQLINSKHFDYDLFSKLINESIYIGEIGLDGSNDYLTTFEKQKHYYEKILDVISQHDNKILSIHSLRAVEDVLNGIKKYLYKSKNKYILHWFTGTLKQSQQAINLNCYFSINHKMLSNSKGQELIKFLPLDKIVLESDAPFTIDKINNSYYKSLIANIAIIKSLSQDLVNKQIYKNSLQLMNLV